MPGGSALRRLVLERVFSGIPMELHIYPRGWHGLGLANGVAYGAHGATHIPHTARWSQACEAWLDAEGFLPPG